MACHLVAYDLNLEAKRPNITDRLKKTFGTWAMLSESSYAVVTDLSPDQVYRVFEDMLDGNDQLYVINLRQPLYGQGPPDTNEWLAKYVPW